VSLRAPLQANLASDFLMKYRFWKTVTIVLLDKINKLEERSAIISNYWNYFCIPFSADEIYELYFSKMLF
jgi:hypothetical protein